jgi:hypothetical protein
VEAHRPYYGQVNQRHFGFASLAECGRPICLEKALEPGLNRPGPVTASLRSKYAKIATGGCYS